MFNFDLENSPVYQGIKWQGMPLFRFAGFLKNLFLVLFAIALGVFIWAISVESFGESSQEKLGGVVLLFLVLFVLFWEIKKFVELKLKNTELEVEPNEAVKDVENFNLADFLSFETAKLVWEAINFSKSKKFSKTTSSTLFYFLIDSNLDIKFIFSRAGLEIKNVKKIVKSHVDGISQEEEAEEGRFSSDFKSVIRRSLEVAGERNHKRVEVEDLIVALAEKDLIFEKILVDSLANAEDIKNLTRWYYSIKQEEAQRKRFWDYSNLLKLGSIGRGLSSGYTVNLDKYSVDWSEKLKTQHGADITEQQGEEENLGGRKELEQLERILAQRDINNAVLVGRPGTRRKRIVKSLAYKSFLGQLSSELNYKRVVELNLSSLLPEVGSVEEAEKTLENIFQEVVSAGNVILVIDNLHNFIGRSEGMGKIDISGLLTSYLGTPSFRMIGITSPKQFHNTIESESGLAEFFQKVEVSQASKEETLRILEKEVAPAEGKHEKFVLYPTLRKIVNLSQRYLPNKPFPKKALELFEETVVYVSNSTKDQVVRSSHANKVLSEKTKIPTGVAKREEKEKLLNLESLIHQRVINQDEAVNKVSEALRRARANVKERKGPMGGFLFLGPTGVGKTETSKALAESYFGSENKMIRLDMSEFQSSEDIERLIGASGKEGLLTTPVKESPFSLILLDEIEKAHSNILNIFLQVLDEGHITDGKGVKVNFKESIIIATSNAGANIIWEKVKSISKQEGSSSKEVSEGENKDKEEKEDQEPSLENLRDELLNFFFEKGVFRPEFINRFDAVVIFKPLSRENLLDISQLMLERIKNHLQKRDIEFIITEPLKKKIVEIGYDPQLGAREMERVIQDNVENVLSRALLEGKIDRGNKVKVTPEFKVKIE